MKKIVLFILLLAGVTASQAQTITAAAQETAAATQWTLTLSLQEASAYTALQANIALPTGLTAADPTSGTLFTSDHQAVCGTLDDGTISLICYSPSSTVFADNSGTLATLTLTASSALPVGTYTVTLSDIRLSDALGNETPLADITVELKSTDGTNGIATLSSNEAQHPIYTLQGTRIYKITRPGIYIQNHRKVFIK